MPESLPIPFARNGSGLLFVLCSAVLAGCAQGGAGTVPAVAARPESLVGAKRHTQLTCPTAYTFKGYPDGSVPEAPLFNLNGTLYGTTPTGGSSHRHGL
jgi:hypothetical protein